MRSYYYLFEKHFRLYQIALKFKNCVQIFPMSSSSGSTMEKTDLTGFRVPYASDDVDSDFSEKDPLKLFDKWFSKARTMDKIKEANAMAVATADKSGKPSVRYVLLKEFGKDGFVFFTNYNSRKGQELAENPNAALLFYWDCLCRQIRIEGSVVKASQQESKDYFYSRPQSSQMSAATSLQSSVIPNKSWLSAKYQEMEKKYPEGGSVPVPKPDHWGGYKVIPHTFEFWCGRTNRLHDRIRFRLPSPGETPDEKLSYTGENGWIYEYLSP